MRRLSLLVLLAGTALITGCGSTKLAIVNHTIAVVGAAPSTQPASDLGIPIVATNNTTRIDGGDAITDAAGVAQAVYPSLIPGTHPQAVTIAPTDDWQAALASSVLMAPPIHAPILLSGSGSLPTATSAALNALAPTGAGTARGAQAIKVGDVPTPSGLRTVSITGADPFSTAAAIDTFQTAAAGRPSPDVIVVSADAPTYAMPAAGYAAESGDPILYVTASSVPNATRQAIVAHGHPHIYVLGPQSVIPHAITKALDKLGTVRRVSAGDPISSAVAFSRYRDPACPVGTGCVPGNGNFGWAVTSGGHGYVFANMSRTLDAAAAAALSGSGQYGPMLLVGSASPLPSAVVNDLENNASGYNQEGPTAAVYNHGWIIGDESAISGGSQAYIDSLLNVLPAK
jgi:hypothetical protein